MGVSPDLGLWLEESVPLGVPEQQLEAHLLAFSPGATAGTPILEYPVSPEAKDHHARLTVDVS